MKKLKQPDQPNVVTAYGKLYDIMAKEYLNGDPNYEAPIYTRVAFEFIMGVRLDEAITRYTPSTIMGALDLFLDNHNMECDCGPDEMSFECFQCNVDKLAKKEIRARQTLVKQGVLNDG